MDRILYKEADGDITCRSRDFDKVFPTLYAYEELEMTPEDIEQTLLRFSSFLMEMTGGRMSKTNYTVQAMVDEAHDYQQKELEEAEQKGYDLGVDSVLRNHFDIPWAEAADLRKNIDHLRELLAAEKEGRLFIQPNLCKPGDTLYIVGYLDSPADAEILGPYPIIRTTSERIYYDNMRISPTPIIRFVDVSWDDIGKSVFLSREDAEAALAKLKEE